MSLTKRVTVWFLTLVMILCLIPQTVFAEESTTSSPQYEIFQEINEKKIEARISLKFVETKTIQLKKIKMPDGTEKTEDLSIVNYTVSENGVYNFKVIYSLGGVSQEESINVEVTKLKHTSDKCNENKLQKNKSTDSNEINKKNMNYIHLNYHDGNDDNDGMNESTSVRTFEKAKSLIQDGDIILLDSYVEINSNETWDLSEFPNSKLQRNTGMDMIVVNPKATLTLKNIVIDGTHYSKINDNSHSIIKLGKLAGTDADGSNVILKSGTILENNKNNRSIGGAIAGFSYDTVTMESGAIIRNNGTIDMTAQFGGGIHLENHGQFIMNGGTIENNHAVRGGGICLIASSMVMNGGEIKNNSANSKDKYAGHYGGGIYVSNFQDWSAVGGDYSREIAGEASFTMNGGTILENKATYQASNGDNGLGGAIATYPAFYAGHEHIPTISININKGDIVGNTAINGGAISAYFDAVDVNISNTNITNNEAKSQGGAIYGVFNSKINLSNTTVSQNKASLGAGIYLYASEMTMKSGEISKNSADNYGGAIYIDSPAWNGETAICNILGGTISGNIAKLGKGSDGIYQNSKLNIGGKVLINKDNDVYLPSSRVIDVISSLNNVTQENGISITSEDCVVEDEQNNGTRLVNYHEEAGGVKAAQDAEAEQLYLPSVYMVEGLVIGKSNADNQLNYMTYIQKEKYPVIYDFVSGTAGKVLPEEVIDMIPVDNNKYLEGLMINAIQPTKTEIKVLEGVWRFKGYDSNDKLSSANNLNDEGYIQFTGTWEFNKNASVINQIPTINAEDKTLAVGDKFDPYKGVTAIDKEDGDLTKEIKILKNEVDTSKAGVYEVTYKVTDSKGASTVKTIKVTVETKNTPVAPVEPDKPNKPIIVQNTSVNDKTPQTVDNTDIMLWTLLLIASGIGLVSVYHKKRNVNQ